MLSLKNRKAVSPVIATVILVAIAITVAVAVAFWIGGITGQYTRFEKLEISTAYCEANATFSEWRITLDLRNTGTIESAIINCLVNGKKIGDYTGITAEADIGGVVTPLDFSAGNKMVLPAGLSGKVILHVAYTGSYSFTSGTTIEVSVLSSAGNNYMKMVTLT